MSAKHKDINATIDRAIVAITELNDLMATVDDVYFGTVCEGFERLEFAFRKKNVIDAAFAFIAERDDAGRRVGSTKAVDYLTGRLGITRADAFNRIENGALLFGTDSEEDELDLGPESFDDAAGEPAPEPAPAPEGETDDERREREAREAEERRQHEEEQQRRREEERRKAEEEAQRRREREAQKKEELRKKLLEEAANKEMMAMINLEMRELNKYSRPGPLDIRKMALDYAEKHSLEDTRAWLRKLIGRANRDAITPRGKKDPYAATRKRKFWIAKEPDSDGGYKFGGYLDAVGATMLLNALGPAAKRGGPDLPPEEDNRKPEQRRYDYFLSIIGDWMADKGSKPGGGLASIVVSATMNQLAEISPDSLLPTTVGTMLTPSDLMRLGAAASDYLMITDDKQFKPLAFGEGRRTASLYQRIALAAAYMVCTEPGCNRPAKDCDYHHMVAYSRGGPTDSDNMVPVCPPDHVNINDHRDWYNNMSYIDRDPETGLVGKVRPDGTIEVNDTVAAKRGALRLLRDEVNGTAEHLSDNPWSPPIQSDVPPQSDTPLQPEPPEAENSTPVNDEQQPISGHESEQQEIDFGGLDIPPAWLYDDLGNYFGEDDDADANDNTDNGAA